MASTSNGGGTRPLGRLVATTLVVGVYPMGEASKRRWRRDGAQVGLLLLVQVLEEGQAGRSPKAVADGHPVLLQTEAQHRPRRRVHLDEVGPVLPVFALGVEPRVDVVAALAREQPVVRVKYDAVRARPRDADAVVGDRVGGVEVEDPHQLGPHVLEYDHLVDLVRQRHVVV
eukprot:CAMPEP_0196653994 /NCGR_PEP_ID=MMETSP1086-20130531/3661_1 /TAXON_ID=77921 /ORGANISM="Cyanoptyche  gloeocystis , Strain SAG4.97" /LENGTH=171 /DNA_ID=CAMNT_0041985485 /DNA_START=835 /DNA_END=1346 /DNA_ORIENTATION=+